MLELKNITKTYEVAKFKVEALKGITLRFRKNEFVSILGPSGCGKTTLLNIIGGLDRYTTGDLIINGKSTKQYTDKDWDTYRNHSVGFIFQTYNLIPHLTVLENVELALTLSGVSKAERQARAIKVLEEVGLADKLYNKPNQLSGGQMQRVAIARALINDPDVLLADEPTGALDSKTSVQIMELLKEIAKDRLIIMVTHNPDLAEQYSNRIIKILDGNIIGDTNPYLPVDEEVKKESIGERIKKTSMSFFTAISLSFKNLLTKKARTFMVAFAGSIGIIGIALILSLSNGFQNYIDEVQKDTLSNYPLTIEKETMDMTTFMQSFTGNKKDRNKDELDKIYSGNVLTDILSSMMSQVHTNNLKEFKKFLESDRTNIMDYVSGIKYGYDLELQIYHPATEKGIMQVNPSSIISQLFAPMGAGSFTIPIFEEMIDNQVLLDSQFEKVAGDWPKEYNQVVVVLNKNNEIPDYVLYSLGIKDQQELYQLIEKIRKGEPVTMPETTFTYDEIMNMTYKLVLNSSYYVKENGKWVDKREDSLYMSQLINGGIDIEIVGIVRPREEVTATSISGTIAYTNKLTQYVINEINKAEIVQQQLANPNLDVFTGLPFETPEITIEMVYAYIATLPQEQQQIIFSSIANMSEEAIINAFKDRFTTTATYEDNLKQLGVVDLEDPSKIYIYPVDFASKDKIASIIKDYNANMTEQGHEENVINYTDYIGLMMSSISTIINTISYVLIGFVAISLVVSSIMIGVITYISVLERTKEIGILRSIGASKRDISRVFNAETLIIGFVSGLLGIGVSLLLTIPINLILKSVANLPSIVALPAFGGIMLVVISMALTFIAGLIPSRIAAKKDPVIALRTE